MKYRSWKIPYDAPEIPAELTQAGFPPLLAALLAQRGLRTPESARAFLDGGGEPLPDPMLLRDMIPTDSRTISTCREVWPFALPGSALEAFGGQELSDHNAVWAECALSK